MSEDWELRCTAKQLLQLRISSAVTGSFTFIHAEI